MNLNLPEIFTTIFDFEKYSISTFGRIRNNTSGKILEAYNRNGYKYINLKSKISKKKEGFLIHRIVLVNFLFNENPEVRCCVDHINGLKDDNRLENLRYASKIENGQNAKLKITNKTSCKGVSYDKERKKFLAAIVYNKKKIYIGRYELLEDAKKARCKKARELFGEFCHISEQE